MNEQIIKTLKESTLFDESYYKSKYEDVVRRNSEPLSHFVRHGHKENRNPNAFFNTKLYREKYLNGDVNINPLYHYITCKSSYNYKISDFFDGHYYLVSNPDVLKSGMNPLVHYLRHGIKEGRESISTRKTKDGTSFNISPIVTNVSKLKICILIPIYNAIEDVVSCVDSVIRNTPLNENIKVVLLNDCSTDKNIKPILNKYKVHPYIKVKHNFRNLGYTCNVNKGIKLAEDRDVILLNSDTIVTPNWIRNMAIAAYSQPNVGTVTAVSNGAGAFSVPEPGLNDIPEHLNIDSMSRIVNKIGGEYIDVPTGNGFCLYIKKDLLDEIGGFDETKFPRGYGEENDFCMRAIEYGWLNIIDTKTYIYHKRSASFKESKHALMESGLAQVKKEFPEYEGVIKSIGGSSVFKELRESVAEKIKETVLSNKIAKPKLMFVISTRTGGTPKTNFDLMKQLSDIYDCYAIASNAKKVEILIAGEYDYEVLEEHVLSQPVKYASHRSGDYELLLRYLLYKYNIDLLHIRHLAWHSLKLPKIAKELYIPVVNSFHDFYTICPSVNLIDSNGIYHSDGVSEGSINPLWHDETVTPMTKAMLSRWQKRMSKSLQQCDYFITTCQSAKDILLNKLDLDVSSDNFTVIPHGRDFEKFIKPESFDDIKEPLKVLLPGNITLTKGAELVKEIKSLDLENNIEFHVIGTCHESLKSFVVYHGQYKRDDFQSLVEKINPHIAAVLSIWPETYCHTLTESWATGLPVVGIDYGAVGERIKRHKAGWLVNNNAKQCLDLLNSLCKNKELLAEKQKYVTEWQNGYGNSNTVSNMTGNYIRIYQELLESRYFISPTPKKLGFIMKGNYPDVPPTAYVRLIDWKEWFEKSKDKLVKYTHWSSVLTSDICDYDEFVIQRDAIPAYAVDWCLNTLSSRGIKYTFEMDDDLLNVPELADLGGVYKNYRPYFKKLIKNAEIVHVTNSQLEKEVSEYNNNVFVRPNKIFDSRWSKKTEGIIDLNLDQTKLNILYYGSRTHQKDLNFLISVLKKANINVHKFSLYVVGCGEFEPSEDIVRLVPESSRYDKFVDWLISVSSNFDVGVAPLIESDFSQNKSYLKCIELSKLGLPVICSNVMPYLELKDSEDKYIFAENHIYGWLKELNSIMEIKENHVSNP